MSNFIDDLRAAHNASGNATTPFNEQEAIQEHVMSWFRGENLPGITSVLIVLAWIAHFVLTRAIRYTLWQIIATLAIIEAPEATFRHESEQYKDKDESPRVSFTEHRTYTSSIRTTLRHLYRIGGPLSFFRGFAVCMAHFTVSFIFISVGGFFLVANDILSLDWKPNSTWQYVFSQLSDDFGDMLLSFIVAPLSIAFTHIIITKPTFRFWLQRLPPLRATIVRVWPALAVYALACTLTWTLPKILRVATGLVPLSSGGSFTSAVTTTVTTTTTKAIGEATQAAAAAMAERAEVLGASPTLDAAKAAITSAAATFDRDAAVENTTSSVINALTDQQQQPWTAVQKVLAATIWLLAQAFRIGFVVPAGVALTRVEAALLPEDDETIVPMDRTFGTAPVAPGILGTPVALTFKQAWRSYGRSDRVRILTLYAKFVAVEALMCAFFAMFLGKDVWPVGKGWNPSL